MLKFRDSLNFLGLIILFGIALFSPTISAIEHGITITKFKDWYFFWWLYENGWQAEIDSLSTHEVAFPWAVCVSVLAAWWIFRNCWFCTSYQLHHCLGQRKLLSILKIVLQNILYTMLVTVLPILVLMLTQHISTVVLQTFQCTDVRIYADLMGLMMCVCAVGYAAEYYRDRLDELDLMADYQRLRPPMP